MPWDDAEEPIRRYVESVAGYEKNRYELDRSTIEKVERHWGFAIKEWGYEVH